MKPFLAVSAIGRDRPGIVAGLTRVLFEHGGNLEDSSMTRLKGDFAVLLLVALREGTDSGPVSAALEAEARTLGLTLQVRLLAPEEVRNAGASAGHPYTLVLYGADKPGLVHRVAEAAARNRLNITDLRSQLTGTDKNPVYSLVLELDAPDDASASRFTGDLKDLKNELRVDFTFGPADADDM